MTLRRKSGVSKSISRGDLWTGTGDANVRSDKIKAFRMLKFQINTIPD